jgi:Homeodomain-like domain
MSPWLSFRDQNLVDLVQLFINTMTYFEVELVTKSDSLCIRGIVSLMPRKSPFSVNLSSEERQTLESMARKYTSPYCDVIRAKIILLANEGFSNDVIASRLDMPRQIVSKWRKRFAFARLPGLEEQPRGGRKARFSPQSRRSG